MKRNWDTIRDILLEVESLEGREEVCYINSSKESIRNRNSALGYDADREIELCDPEKYYNATLLACSGFVNSYAYDNDINITGMTMEGHNLLDSIREKGIWEKTKKRMSSVGGSASLSVLKMVAESVVKGELGLG